jgi:hypothetical protein
VTTDDFQTDYEYLLNQRRRNLPAGESRQGPLREPETGLAERLGNWMLQDGTEKALTANVMTEMFGERGFRSQSPNNFEMAISCDRVPNQVSENRKARGELSKEKSPLSLLYP